MSDKVLDAIKKREAARRKPAKKTKKTEEAKT